MEDDQKAHKLLCTYQFVWISAVFFTAALALTMPFANIVIWKIEGGHFRHEIDLDVNVLNCFTGECQKKQNEAIANEEYYSWRKLKTNVSHPSFIGQTQLGSLGAILSFLFTGLIITTQIPSLLSYCCYNNIQTPRICGYRDCNRSDPSSSLRMMVAGSVSLILGLLWYAVIMMSLLDGGSFMYGYWLTILAAFSTLVFACGAYRNKNIADSLYQAIPDMLDQYGCSSQLDDLLDYEPNASHFDDYQIAYSLSTVAIDEGLTAA